MLISIKRIASIVSKTLKKLKQK